MEPEQLCWSRIWISSEDELLLIPADASSPLCPAFPLQVGLVLLGGEFTSQSFQQ